MGEDVGCLGDGVGLFRLIKDLMSKGSLLSLSELELELEVSLDREGLDMTVFSVSSAGWVSRFGEEGTCLASSLYWKGLEDLPG